MHQTLSQYAFPNATVHYPFGRLDGVRGGRLAPAIPTSSQSVGHWAAVVTFQCGMSVSVRLMAFPSPVCLSTPQDISLPGRATTTAQMEGTLSQYTNYITISSCHASSVKYSRAWAGCYLTNKHRFVTIRPYQRSRDKDSG